MSSAPLFLFLFFFYQPGNDPLIPVWSPDHQVLATTKVDERFVTPEGANYTLFLNGRAVYPAKKKFHWFPAYDDQHTFLDQLQWSPDGQRMAFAEKVYGWEYADPYNRDFDGSVSNLQYWLVIVDRTGKTIRWRISEPRAEVVVQWRGTDEIVVDGRLVDLRAPASQPVR